jgi:hypothetical protein
LLTQRLLAKREGTERVLVESQARTGQLHELLATAQEQQQMVPPNVLAATAGLHALLNDAIAAVQWPEPEPEMEEHLLGEDPLMRPLTPMRSHGLGTGFGTGFRGSPDRNSGRDSPGRGNSGSYLRSDGVGMMSPMRRSNSLLSNGLVGEAGFAWDSVQLRDSFGAESMGGPAEI